MTNTTPPPSREDTGKLEYGCDHYRRRCKIRAPCCQKIFSCRHCHNEATNSLSNPKDRHEIVRHNIQQVICSLCKSEQQVAQVCTNCGVKMGEYFCNICKFYDDDTTKGQFHCEGCEICRVGGRDKFFHCEKCGSCYQLDLNNNHSCVENSLKNDCPVCYEYLFDSVKGATVMKCGHTMHTDCFQEMAEQNQYRCPICSKTVLEMGHHWRMLDQEVYIFLCYISCHKSLSSTSLADCLLISYTSNFDTVTWDDWFAGKPDYQRHIEACQMPEEYRCEVSILCNDCNQTSKTAFHIVGLKCSHCKSYNTRRISTPAGQ